MKHLFIVTSPDGQPRQFELKGKRIGVGRGEDNEICLEVDAVSSSHLEFRKTDQGYEVEDLGSTNGTRVNGKKIATLALSDGDRLLIGETVPAHFLLLGEGETWKAGTAVGSDADHKDAAEFVSMSDRLKTLEADIEVKQEEAATIEAQLVELRASHQQQLTDFGEAQLALDALQKDIEEKKQQGSASPGELQNLEESLLENTQKVKLMSTHLAEQKQQISQLEQQGPVVPRENPHAPSEAESPQLPPIPVPPAPVTIPTPAPPVIPPANNTPTPIPPAGTPTVLIGKRKQT
jgi:pSer/pThr/pTyr-binding forkhead associated (FHA) protein